MEPKFIFRFLRSETDNQIKANPKTVGIKVYSLINSRRFHFSTKIEIGWQ